MSNFGPSSGPPSPMRPPTMSLPTGRVIARYPTYPLAQRAVDFLSDNRLPVQAVTIVGTDLRVVERVTGLLSYGRVALQGALSGAWFGLLIGILLSLANAAPDGGVATAMVFGSGFGLLFAVIGYATTRGKRDFTSRSEIIAGEYQIVCADALVVQASELLARLPSAGPPVDLPPPVVPRPPVDLVDWPPTQAPSDAGPGEAPQAAGAQPAPVAPSWPPAAGQPGSAPRPVGPTYSEMIEKQKRERRERERAEREAARKAAAERAAAEAAAAEAAAVSDEAPAVGDEASHRREEERGS